MLRPWLPLIGFLASCGGDAEQKLDQARSWVATAEKVGRDWGRAAVPRRYALDTLEIAEDELRTTLSQLDQPVVPDAPASISSLARAINAGDAAAASRAVAELGAAKRTLEARAP